MADQQDLFACLQKAQKEDIVANSRINRDYYSCNYHAILDCLCTLVKSREQAEQAEKRRGGLEASTRS